ncbi:ABC transporter permease/substrate-binding protein [Schleiferilactobacillus shenzhenensis]|uniref:OpuCB n=1 Tax=Schleiferilactobacillus shenzhenensis LY-73 TaxID=1231336 RepID=U4TUR3_9LACO|nr:ABC transporter permease/substrate-binding protein [Schleiferilactobacillus shenzhenensis]ERL65613.1 OpuCB [Schleiferilactobacillus shenzhenensis LY-73]
MDIISTLVDRRQQLLSALGQHLSISLIALVIAIIIAMPLAFWAARHSKAAAVLLQIAGILQTIPSLALLGLLIPLVGIGTTPAVIALVIYALLPIFQNTYIGITGIDPALEEAADAFGMGRWRKLRKVELPLAAPTIIGGIRTALVLIIGTATLAALIGAGGLGSFILLGIDRNNTALIVIGAVFSALLAIILSALISWLAKQRWQWTAGLVVLLILGVGGTQIASRVNQPETVVIAGKLGSEPDILINMYKQLIEHDDPHIRVQLKSNFGKTTFLFNAVKTGSVDIYPEFTGTVLETLVKQDRTAAHLTAAQTYTAARQALSKQFQMTYLQPMAYQNTYGVAVKRRFAQDHGLTTISSLRNVTDQLSAGFTLEFLDRPDGYQGLKKVYGLHFPTHSFEPALRYAAINNGKVNLVDVYSTDSEIVQYKLQVLRDDKHLFPPYQGAPLMRTAFARQHPGIVRSLNKLAGHITDKQMQQMNYAVNVRNESPAKVARTYLTSHGLLKGGD